MSERFDLSNLPKIETLSSKLIVVHPRFLQYRLDRVRFPSGQEGVYYWTDDERPAAATVALDKQHGRRKTLLVPQYRYPTDSVGWEVPCGGIEEADKTAWDAAARELAQEGGYTAEHWYQLPLQIENVGRGNSRSEIFVAAGITALDGAAVDPDEVIGEGQWFDDGQIDEMLLDGKINAGHTQAALSVAGAFLRCHSDHIISQLVA